MRTNTQYRFQGDPSLRDQVKDCHPDSPRELEPYIAEDNLIQAINLAHIAPF